MDRNYTAAVSEFEKVISKDPSGKLGLQAMYRAAMTQSLSLFRYGDAVQNFRAFSLRSTDPREVWEAQLQMGEIFFTKTEQYEQAIAHYESLIKQKPEAPEVPEFMYRIGKSYFYIFDFGRALQQFQAIIHQYPISFWAEKAALEIGATYFTQGNRKSESHEDEKEGYQEALDAYRSFIHRHPKSSLVPEAEFGIASCLEELNQMGEALNLYQKLKGRFSSDRVIDVKLKRIRERMAQQGVSLQ